MVQGHTQQDCGSKGRRTSFFGSRTTSEKEEPQHGRSQKDGASSVRILVELRMTNGLHISQKYLNYQELKRLIEKLEGLC